MPVCVDCRAQPQSAAVAGYDGKWRCLRCNEIHAAAVLRESGNSAPNASEDRPFVSAKQTSRTAEERRQERAKKMLEKYGITKRNEWR